MEPQGMTYLEQELQKLRENMADMSNLVVNQIHKSIRALVSYDTGLAREVIANEKRVNAYELKIDKDCETVMTLQNPMASDMRFVFATLKINYNMERIGDHAKGIAKYAKGLGKPLDAQLIAQTRLVEMGEVVEAMIQDATEAYVQHDSKLASQLFDRDSVVDDINREAPAIIAAYIRENLDNTLQAINLLSIIRKLERVGDHLTNIAEEVIFSVDAKVLKHSKR